MSSPSNVPSHAGTVFGTIDDAFLMDRRRTTVLLAAGHLPAWRAIPVDTMVRFENE